MSPCVVKILSFFFFNDTATTEIYTLSLHDALPISHQPEGGGVRFTLPLGGAGRGLAEADRPGDDQEPGARGRSEEHTSELQSLAYLVCRLLLEKKKRS